MTAGRQKLLPFLPAFLGLSASGCEVLLPVFVAKVPPAPLPTSKTPTRVNASSGRTWDAVFDVLAANNISIRITDRLTGSFATNRVDTPNADTTWADCGRDAAGRHVSPDWAVFDITVHGDSFHTSLKVAASWSINPRPGLTSLQCATSGVRELLLEKSIKDRAEGHPTTS